MSTGWGRGTLAQYTKDASDRLLDLARLRDALESKSLERCHGLLSNMLDFIERKTLPALQQAEELERELAGERARSANLRAALDATVKAWTFEASMGDGIDEAHGPILENARAVLAETEGSDG